MARPLSSSRALAPTLSGPQLAAVVNEVAASSPIAEVAVAQACQRQSAGIVRTRSATLYATGTMTTTAAGVYAAGTTQDIFNVPVGQIGSGSAVALSKAQTNMTQAGLLASEAFSVDKIGFSVELPSAQDALSGDLVNPMLQWIYNNTVAELHLGGQDVQILGVLAQWVDTFVPQPTAASLSGAVGPVNTAFRPGVTNSGYDALRDFELFIPQQVPFKVKLTMPAASAFTIPIAVAAVPFLVRCSMYGTSVTAIQA